MDATRELDHRCTWAISKIRALVAEGRRRGWLDGKPIDVSAALADLTLPMEAEQSPMKIAARRLRLTPHEYDALWFLACVALDPAVEAAAQLLVEPNTAGVTAQLVDRLLTNGNGDVETALQRLSTLRLVEFPDSVRHSRRCAVAATERALSLVRGKLGTDLSRWADPTKSDVYAGTIVVGDGTIAELTRAMRATRAVVVVTGKPNSGKRTLLARAAAEAKVDCVEVDARRLPTDLQACREQLRSLATECRLLGYAPLLCNIEVLGERDAARIELVGAELVAELETNVYVTSNGEQPQLRWKRPIIVVEMRPPTGLQRARFWRELIPQASESDAEHLATQYPLAPALMYHAARAVKARAVERSVTPDDVTHGIRAVLDDGLGRFAKRVEVTQSWDDLVIEEDQGLAIGELIARIRQRRTVYERWGFAAKVGKGLGVAALFSGPPGTGKTMVAALIAKELALELYQVDMAKITSKFIGETEKQLADMFDAAEAGHAILLFDEADSLFGKRTEVRSSNDRYANLETNYLLQRLESFTGICLLTSNHESNIDPAFQRRLSLHLRFQVPDADEREKLWRAMLPPEAPVETRIDFKGLARRFEMTGGSIRNAALRAAFLAAEEAASICEAHLEHAARVEYEGMGKISAPRPKVESLPRRITSSL
jgi:Mrp family chromosome partitioning ATPase